MKQLMLVLLFLSSALLIGLTPVVLEFPSTDATYSYFEEYFDLFELETEFKDLKFLGMNSLDSLLFLGSNSLPTFVTPIGIQGFSIEADLKGELETLLRNTELKVSTGDVFTIKNNHTPAYVWFGYSDMGMDRWILLSLFLVENGLAEYEECTVLREDIATLLLKVNTRRSESNKENLEYIAFDEVLVEGGIFTMGDTWGENRSAELPAHEVEFTYNFNIGKYEVTFEEYDFFCEATGRRKSYDQGWGRGSRPAINVSWWDAIEYCNWLSERTGLPKAYDCDGNLLDAEGNLTKNVSMVLGYRLPTEAEWEYAARGGNKSEGYKYSGSDNVSEVAWYEENSYINVLNMKATHLVGLKKPNEIGLYDMSGNVYEWCSDFFRDYSTSAQKDLYEHSGSGRVIRGGSYASKESIVRSAARIFSSTFSFEPTILLIDLGFRIARTLPYEGENRKPYAPHEPRPTNNITMWTTEITLSWDCIDPDGDVVKYDVYFGKDTNVMEKVALDQIEKEVNISGLSYDATYYWKVVAIDEHGASEEGELWVFSVKDGPPKPPVVFVEKGSFTMGDTWGDGDNDEKPIHNVTLNYDFFIGKYEVTFDEYDAFCEATERAKSDDWGFGRDNRPVINVTWWDAVDYCNWLSDREGIPRAYNDSGCFVDSNGNETKDPSKVIGYRLPTETEWEYAARGGNKSKGYRYSGSPNMDDVAWFLANLGVMTEEVGGKIPNELGIYDMSGNVSEWCSDWYGSYTTTEEINPYSSTVSFERVIRGGCCLDDTKNIRVTVRSHKNADQRIWWWGFRICRTALCEAENKIPCEPYNFSNSYSQIIQEIVLLEKGSFTMGDTWGDGFDWEKPIHEVLLTYNLYIGKYEVTFDQYDAFCEATSRDKPSDEGWGRGNRPVINVSWWAAIAYCNWLSEREKLPKAYGGKGNFLDKNGIITTDPSKVLGYRLPTEAEWEYAARGGNKRTQKRGPKTTKNTQDFLSQHCHSAEGS